MQAPAAAPTVAPAAAAPATTMAPVAAPAAAPAAASAPTTRGDASALEEVDDGWSGTRLVRLRRAAPGAVRIVDDAVRRRPPALTSTSSCTSSFPACPTAVQVPAALARGIYQHTLAEGRSWGTYVTLAEATTEEADDGGSSSGEPRGGKARGGEAEARERRLAAQLVRALWLGAGGAAAELLAPERHRVHGFALWANAASQGEECAYHLDYAELHRRRQGILHPPILASTMHVTDFRSSGAAGGAMRGGEFGVNTQGLSHYLRFGHHGVLARADPAAFGRDWAGGDGWVKAGYRFRRAILFDGELPHCATPVEALPAAHLKRVVVGINVFDTDVGPHVAGAPVHSAAYRRAMAELQSFRRVPPSEQGAGPRYAMVSVGGGEGGAAAPCEQCGASPARLAHGERWFCGAACLKAHRRGGRKVGALVE